MSLPGDTEGVNRFDELVEKLRTAVFDGPGEVAPAVRRAAGSGTAPDVWSDYVAKVCDASWRITDADVEQLKSVGCTEEQIFEVTVAAATGAGLHRLELGLRALGEES